MKRLSDKARLYARSYGQPPYGKEIEGTAELLLRMADKLEEYEEFEKIFRSKMTDAACDVLKDKEEFTRWLDRNKWIAKKCDEYARAEEQGKLLKLPCAVGDAYYRIENDGVNPPRVREWKVRTLEFCVTVRDCIGKTVFLTREEAEAALKDSMEGNHAKTSTTIQK